jgi:hypothetical protein
MSRAKITKAVVDRLPPKTWIWDTALAGFGCRRQKDASVYYIRWQQDGRQRMHALGRHGPLTPEAARLKAKKALARSPLAAIPSQPTTAASCSASKSRDS